MLARSFIFALCLVAAIGCGSPPATLPDVLLISIDTLRPDHLGLYGYARETSPEIDDFFSAALVFDRAYSTEASTPPSVYSMLTGRLPQEHGVRMFYQKPSEPQAGLGRRLGRAGYQTAAVVSNGVLTAEACGLDSEFDWYDDFVDEKEPYRRNFERRATATTDAALGWLEVQRDAGKPHFLWVHYIDPHAPYDPPPAAPRDFQHTTVRPLGPDRGRVLPWRLHPGVDDAHEYIDLYDEEIAYMDSEVGRLLKGYQRLGLASDAIVVFTADHGEAMMEHEKWFGHGYQVYEEIVRVPLMIRAPRLAGARVSESVSLVDLMPTLLELAGQQVPVEFEGRSLLGDPYDPVLAEGGGVDVQHRSLLADGLKYVISVSPDGSQERRVFDLVNDPLELAPRAWTDSDSQAAALLIALIESDPDPAGIPTNVVEGERLTGPKIRSGLDEETREKLRSLGYLD